MIKALNLAHKGRPMAKSVAENSSLSMKAKGLYVVLFALRGSTNFPNRKITELSDDGPAATLQARRELIRERLLDIHPLKDGEVWTLVNEEPKK